MCKTVRDKIIYDLGQYLSYSESPYDGKILYFTWEV